MMNELFVADDPRAWLEDELARRGLLKRDFAAAIGVTPGQLTNHLRRVRTLRPVCEEQVIRVLALQEDEAAHYRALVDRDRMEPDQDREWADARVQAGRLGHREQRWPGDYPAGAVPLGALTLRALAQTRSFRPEASWIATQLPSSPRVEEVQGWLDWLLQHGLLERGDDGNLRVPQEAGVLPLQDLPRACTQGLFAELREQGVEALDRYSGRIRHFGMLTQAVPVGLLPELTRELRDLRLRIQARCEVALLQGGADRVFVFFQQLVPLTRPLQLAVSRGGEVHVPAAAPPLEVAPLYQSLDYRDTLARWRGARGLTLEQVARKLRHNLPPGERLTRQHVHAVLNGQAHCDAAQLRAWCQCMSLDEQGRRYLAASLAYQIARDPVERERCWSLVQELRQLGLGTRVRRSSFELLRSWQPSAVLEISRHPRIVLDPPTIRQLLLPPLELQEPVEDTLELLLAVGGLRPAGDGGLEAALGTTLQVDPAEMTRDSWRSLLRDSMRLGAWAEAELAPQERTLEAVVLAVPQPILPAICRDLDETRERIQARLDRVLSGNLGRNSEGAPSQLPDRVWSLTQLWFPLSEGPMR